MKSKKTFVQSFLHFEGKLRAGTSTVSCVRLLWVQFDFTCCIAFWVRAAGGAECTGGLAAVASKLSEDITKSGWSDPHISYPEPSQKPSSQMLHLAPMLSDIHSALPFRMPLSFSTARTIADSITISFPANIPKNSVLEDYPFTSKKWSFTHAVFSWVKPCLTTREN